VGNRRFGRLLTAAVGWGSDRELSDPNPPVASVFFRGLDHYLYINVISNHSSTIEWSEVSTVNTS
jgi:hypothetical protein